jgi:hypothetical protein
MGDDVIAIALDYWEQLRGTRLMPANADIDPVAIRHFLPNVMLVDVLRDPLDFSCRLVGGEIERVTRAGPRGRRFSQSRNVYRGSSTWSDYERTVVSRQPFVGAMAYASPDATVRALRHGLMPLSTDGANVNMIFAVVAIERG